MKAGTMVLIVDGFGEGLQVEVTTVLRDKAGEITGVKVKLPGRNGIIHKTIGTVIEVEVEHDLSIDEDELANID